MPQDALESRLENWKFEQALQYLKGEPAAVKRGVRTLARLFGNCGWFDGGVARLIESMVELLVLARQGRAT